MKSGRSADRIVDVPCTLEIEVSQASLHAHVELEGIHIEPGDSVRVHAAPIEVGFDGRLQYRSRATVTRASRLARAWTRFAGMFELGELYEVGFSARRPR
jgi:hypothetical protein